MNKKSLLWILIIVIVCSLGFAVYKENRLESGIEDALLYSFDIPNNELFNKEILNSDNNNEMRDLGVYQMEDPISNKSRKKIQNYFTEAELDNFINETLSPYFLMNLNNEMEMKPNKIKISKRDNNSYDYELILDCQIGEKSFIKKICGDLQLDDNKKISYFKITDDNGLLEYN